MQFPLELGTYLLQSYEIKCKAKNEKRKMCHMAEKKHIFQGENAPFDKAMASFDVATILKAPKGGVCFSIQMEDFLDRNSDRRVIGIHFHDVGHHVPPLLRDWVYVGCVLRIALALTLLIAKEDIRVLVPIDAVVAHAGVLDLLAQLWP